MGSSLQIMLAALGGVLVLGSWIRFGWRGALRTVIVIGLCILGVLIAQSQHWMIYLSILAVTVSLGAALMQIWKEAHGDARTRRHQQAVRERNRQLQRQREAEMEKRLARSRPLTAGEAADRLQTFKQRRGRR